MYNAYMNLTTLPGARYENPLGHHVTEVFFRGEAPNSVDLISKGWQAIMVRELACNGVHCGVVVFIKDGTVIYRNGNGNRYHITISVARGHAPKESNDIIGRYYNTDNVSDDLSDYEVNERTFLPLNLLKMETYK